jgi:hypothetical protein
MRQTALDQWNDRHLITKEEVDLSDWDVTKAEDQTIAMKMRRERLLAIHHALTKMSAKYPDTLDRYMQPNQVNVNINMATPGISPPANPPPSNQGDGADGQVNSTLNNANDPDDDGDDDMDAGGEDADDLGASTDDSYGTKKHKSVGMGKSVDLSAWNLTKTHGGK